MKKSIKINEVSKEVLSIVTKDDYEVSVKANQENAIDHFLFVVKSEYGLGQLSTKLDVIMHNGLFFAVEGGSVKFEVAMNGDFEIMKMPYETFNRIEASL